MNRTARSKTSHKIAFTHPSLRSVAKLITAGVNQSFGESEISWRTGIVAVWASFFWVFPSTSLWKVSFRHAQFKNFLAQGKTKLIPILIKPVLVCYHKRNYCSRSSNKPRMKSQQPCPSFLSHSCYYLLLRYLIHRMVEWLEREESYRITYNSGWIGWYLST